MGNIFKKALGLFVEFEPEQGEKKAGSWGDDGLPLQVKPPQRKQESEGTEHLPANSRQQVTAQPQPAASYQPSASQSTISPEDADKFEKHFEELFDGANLPGPDYYEFWKMMETLEAAVPDDKIRLTAVYASLQVQGLSKEKLLETAAAYQQIIEKDRTEFQGAVNAKASKDIEGRKATVVELEKKNAANAEKIQQLTKEIQDNNAAVEALKKEVIDEEAKLNNNRNGYNIACDAMMAMIGGDIQKIKTHL